MQALASKRRIMAYISQMLLFYLIILYAVLSQSLFSCLALACMFLAIAFTIATPLRIAARVRGVQYVSAYPAESVIWIVFLSIQLVALIFKLIMLLNPQEMSQQLMEFLQIQSPLSMFLPFVMLPFALGAAFVRTRMADARKFKEELGEVPTVVTYLALGLLVALMEIFSMSIIGLIFFLSLMALMLIGKMSFQSKLSRLYLILLQVICLLVLLINFLATSSFLTLVIGPQNYPFYGIGSLVSFKSNPLSRAHCFFVLLIFSLLCLMNRFVIYTAIHTQLTATEHDNMQNKQASPTRRPIRAQSFREVELQGVEPTARRYTLDNKAGLKRKLINNSKDQGLLQSLDHEGTSDPSTLVREKQSKLNWRQRLQTTTQRLVKTGKQFVTSAIFSLRVTELLSIIVIQRYNTVFSLVPLCWLFVVSTTDRKGPLLKSTVYIVLPAGIANFLITYLYNITDSPLQALTNQVAFGFTPMENSWLDIIIFNLYFTYIFLFIRSSKAQLIPPKYKKKAPSKLTILIAVIFRYSYIVVIVVLYFIGFSALSLINLVFVCLFLIFFARGQNILIKKKMYQNSFRQSLTTFSTRYWLVIVRYTLGVILAKYIYFLFFEGQAEKEMGPIGLNTLYPWAFNFSLSQKCASNTSPFFGLFILCEIQTVIYRSNIYMNHSFSAVSSSSCLKQLTESILELYYQSFYYVSGIIVIGCSYNWSFFGLVIIGAICFGLMRGFSKRVLGLVLITNLTLFILNYCALFLNNQVVKSLLGDSSVAVLTEISLLLGLEMNQAIGLSRIFRLNVAIFYFSVKAFKLARILATQVKTVEKEISISQTVMDSQFQDEKFAENYQKIMIQSTQRLFATNLLQKHPWLRYLTKFLSVMVIVLVTIFVIVGSLYFRLSLSMLLFIIAYMVYYFSLFDQIGKAFVARQYNERLLKQLKHFRAQGVGLSNQNEPSHFAAEDTVQNWRRFVVTMSEDVLSMKYDYKQTIWKYSSWLSVACLMLTYSAQFFIAPFYTNYGAAAYLQTIQTVLFVLGVSVDKQSTFARQIYFYYVMIIINVLQKLLLEYVDEYRGASLIEPDSIKEILSVQNPLQVVDSDLGNQFIEQVVIVEPMVVDSNEESNESLGESVEVRRQANMLISFDYQHVSTQIEWMEGLLNALIRFYLWLMLINVYAKSNIFAFAYLTIIIVFWFRVMDFKLVRQINKAAIIILILQYIVLLLDINSATSPLPPPTTNLSALQLLIPSSNWVQFIAISSSADNDRAFLLSFLINSIVIFLTELYYTLLELIAMKFQQLIGNLYARYLYMMRKLPESRSLHLNYGAFKPYSYKVAHYINDSLLVNSHLYVAFLVFGLLSASHNYLSLLLLFSIFVYLFLSQFTMVLRNNSNAQITRAYFQVISTLLFIIIFISIVFSLPVFTPEQKSTASLVGVLVNLEEIIVILLLRLWLDFSYSSSFEDTLKQTQSKMKLEKEVLGKCVAYAYNNDIIRSNIAVYQEMLQFQNNIREAMQTIQQWRAMIQTKIKTASIGLQAIEERKEIDRQDEESKREILTVLKQFMERNLNLAFRHSYYDIVQYVHSLTNRIYKPADSLPLWRYISQDYQLLSDILTASENSLSNSAQSIADQDQELRFSAILKLRAETQKEGKAQTKLQISTPDHIILNLKPETSSFSKNILAFMLSNFQYLLVMLVWVYYILNPCLLSLPPILYYFIYALIYPTKFTGLLVLYFFALICAAEAIRLALIPTGDAIKYLFHIDDDSGAVQYNLPYLYFLIFVAFVHEQLLRHKGIKYKTQNQIEDFREATLRVLLNEQDPSHLNLWRYFQRDESINEKQNPLKVACSVVEGTAKADLKVGVDLYPFIAVVQIFLTIYLIFFYPLMALKNGQAIQQTTKYYQFSSEMVIAVLAHIASIIAQRKITLMEGRKQLIKYLYTLFILSLFVTFVWYIAPYSTPNNYKPNSFLIVFAVAYFIYFMVSAMQVRLGYKKNKMLNSIMTRRGYSNYYALTVYAAIPFLNEIKILMDWTFTETSMTIFDWFKLFGIYLSAFKAKIYYLDAISLPLGLPLKWYYKSVGCFGFILIFLIIFGPMILFSGLNPIAQPNLVTAGSMSLGISITNGNTFALYATSHFSTPPNVFNQTVFDNEHFNQVPFLQQMTASEIPEQFQSVTYESFGDSNWGISMPNYNNLISLIGQSIIQLQANQTPTNNFTITVTYLLVRSVAQTIAINSNFAYPSNGSSLNLPTLQALYSTLTTCNKSIIFPEFYNSLIRLNTVGTSYKPRPIPFVNADNVQPYLMDVNLTLFCFNQNTIDDTNLVYWEFSNTGQDSSGVELYVYCDKYQNVIGGLSFTALYTSVILVVAGFIRSLFDGNLPLTPYQMNPKPDSILQICEAIGVLRLQRHFQEEYLMYYQLIDVMRSPEIMKHLSGTYPSLIEQHSQRLAQKGRNSIDLKND